MKIASCAAGETGVEESKADLAGDNVTVIPAIVSVFCERKGVYLTDNREGEGVTNKHRKQSVKETRLLLE